ncbi:GDSL family lipase [Paenibacillus psychroresistens]|uniref:GDSL family lipase n=1 Tax=Paenibacillus psychroresistens TaxID=1778678 RepID=A0A6B8RSN8_9BACL|nr:SGNH/GDSL hydrolase family protein [Paenibacillus psychroresistens]QGQ99450.1 GDSL family lipase [Paenibacillus psychroresistens]
MKLQQNEKLVMIGDSITDCGRARPVGEGLFEAIGKGYVAQVEALISSTYPQRKIRVVNVGSGGNTVRDLEARWQTDVTDLKPDWLSIMIGINDVWRQYDTPYITESHVYIEEYTDKLNKLVEQSKKQVKGIILMTPFYLEPNPNDAMRATMDQYGQAVKAIAEAHGTLFVDIQAAFAPVLKEIYPATLGWDRVHPSQVGHMVITRAFLNAIDFSWQGE